MPAGGDDLDQQMEQSDVAMMAKMFPYYFTLDGKTIEKNLAVLHAGGKPGGDAEISARLLKNAKALDLDKEQIRKLRIIARQNIKGKILNLFK